MASLHKDPRGKSPFWYCAFMQADGKRTFKSTKKTKHKQADEVCRGWERAAQLGRQGVLTEAQARKVLGEIYERANGEALTFSSVEQYLREWIKSKTLVRAGGTVRRYRDIVEAFIAHLGAKAKGNIASLTPKDIQSFRDTELRDGKSNRTANMAVKTLRISLNVARRQGTILSNPAEAVELLPERPGVRGVFTRHQILDLLKEADAEWKGMILLGACQGLRISDAARLTWANIDFERRSIRFHPQKDREDGKQLELEVPMHPDVESYLLSVPIKTKRPDAPLFPVLFKKKATGRIGLSNSFSALMEKAGIKREAALAKVKGKGRQVFDLSYHSFRHTAVSQLANAGVPAERRMKLSGHKSSVHHGYTHIELELLRQDLEKVSSFTTDKGNSDNTHENADQEKRT